MEVWMLMLWRFEGWKRLCSFEWGRRKKLLFFWLMGWHDRANLLENEDFFFIGCGGFGFWSTAPIFFRFFASYLDKYLQNNLKQRKANKIKVIKYVGCLPRSARLESLAWRLERGFSTLYPIFHKETRASNWHSLSNHTWLSQWFQILWHKVWKNFLDS